ncbi:MAG: mandelate racemase/muconate lactonizing enzyme family protein [Aestuariivirgaceae bacterium]
MKINRIDTWKFQPPFRDGPYVMSHITQDFAYGRILRIRTDNGLTGLGEIVFAPSVSVEDRMNLAAKEGEYLSDLIGKNVDSLTGTAEQMRPGGKPWCGIAFGLETAWYDVIGKHRNQPVSQLLGTPQTDAVTGYFSVSERTSEKVTRRITGAHPATKVFQLKIGIGTLDDDEAHVTAALAAMRDNQILLADANGGWSISEAKEVASRFDDPRIVWEEPCTSYDDNAAVARAIAEPVMVDQCVGNLATATRAANDGLAASLCIKPAFIGGLNPGRDVIELCRQKNLQIRIDGPWCVDIATAAILHLALTAPPALLISSCDLREPLVIEPDLQGVVHTPSGDICPPPGPGLGITIKDNFLGPPEATYGT